MEPKISPPEIKITQAYRRDTIETTKVQTAMGSYRWSTESVARDRLFLKYLGVDTE